METNKGNCKSNCNCDNGNGNGNGYCNVSNNNNNIPAFDFDYVYRKSLCKGEPIRVNFGGRIFDADCGDVQRVLEVTKVAAEEVDIVQGVAAEEKVKVYELGPLTEPEIFSIKLESGADIKIQRRVSYEKILDGINWAANYVLFDKPYVSSPILRIVTDLTLVKLFTNIDMGLFEAVSGVGGVDVTPSQAYEFYDFLSQNGVMDLIEGVVDWKQVRFLKRGVEEVCEEIVKYSNSMLGVINTLSNDSRERGKDLEKSLGLLEDEDKFKFVNRFLEVVDGGAQGVNDRGNDRGNDRDDDRVGDGANKEMEERVSEDGSQDLAALLGEAEKGFLKENDNDNDNENISIESFLKNEGIDTAIVNILMGKEEIKKSGLSRKQLMGLVKEHKKQAVFDAFQENGIELPNGVKAAAAVENKELSKEANEAMLRMKEFARKDKYGDGPRLITDK